MRRRAHGWQHAHGPHGHAHPFRHRGPRLQHQLFWGFGFIILTTLLVSAAIFAFSHTGPDPHGRPWLRPLGLFTAAMVVWGLSGVMARRIARPLLELSRVAQDLGDGKLERRARLPWRGAREVKHLAVTINEMAARIESQVRGQRELMGAVSHELRTPLARMRVLLETLQEREAPSPELVAQLEREIVEMDGLVGELLASARVDAGALDRRALDTRELAQRAIERSALERVEVDVAPGAERIDGDPTLLARALGILLDNAHKHGASRAALRVCASEGEGEVELALEDDGPGIAPEDLTRIFEPFARGRGKDRDEQHGVGLGLYLVRRIAEAHGGAAFASNRETRGARVGFRIAAAQPASRDREST